MLSTSTFTVYNASAGSGKTYTLVKEYIKILLSSADPFDFQQILAVTFTNKAAYEMKERVLKNLKKFALHDPDELFYSIQRELNVDDVTLQRRSQKILNAILENYSAFNITTIDSFVHKLIKSFAFDLGLSQNFEVEMDSEELLKESIDVLISKIGVNQELTRVLLQYAKNKSNDDKSWDIAKDLFEASKMLLKEDDLNRLKKLDNKTLQDFESLAETLTIQNKEFAKEIKKKGIEGIEKINQLGLEFSDFQRSSFPNLLKNCRSLGVSGNIELSFTDTLDKAFEGNGPLYPKRIITEKKEFIDNNFPFFQEIYYSAKENYARFRFNRLLLQNIIPVATLKLIHEELQILKEQNNIQLNAEFNHILSKSIQNQPAPFIYERIGQKFRHFFVDEMQDTSELQWNNFLPLLHNALSQEGTSLMLVGDGKQSIYRWRGGKAEQFIELGNEKKQQTIFPVRKKVETLDTNYRSFSQVVDFNNRFFSFAASYLKNTDYVELYKNTAKQEILPNKKGGYVSIHFVEEQNEDEKHKKYANRIVDIINSTRKEFDLGDICIIVRKRDEGVHIAEVLTENGIPIISSESLLLKNNKKVQFLICLIEYSYQPTDDNKFHILYFLHDHFKLNVSIHKFVAESANSLDFQSLLGVDFNLALFSQLSLYEKVEYALNVFHLSKESDAYVQFFLDEVLKWQQKEMGVQEVLQYWALKKDKLSIVSPEEANAVQIMTIHKSKGLEFPVVIYSGDVDIYYDRDHLWLSKSVADFEDFILPKRKELSSINSHTEFLYHQRRNQLELDALNLLYVTLTRAKEQLYIVTDGSKKTIKSDLKYFSHYFKAFLDHEGEYKDEKRTYDFGNINRVSVRDDRISYHKYQEVLSSNFRGDRQINILSSASKLWGTELKRAQDYGKQFHEILSHIKLPEHVDVVLGREFQQGRIHKEQFHALKSIIDEIVHHPKLTEYYSREAEIFNERTLIDTDGQLMIPDRLIFMNNEVVILDYKTGEMKDLHRQQLYKYEQVLQSMGYTRIKKVLVYVSDTIQVLEF